MVDILTPLAVYGAGQYIIPRALGVAGKVKLAYDTGYWLGQQAAHIGNAGAQAGAPPAHNPGPQVDAFLAALGGGAPKKRKLNRYQILLREEMKKSRLKGKTSAQRKKKFAMAAKKAALIYRKEKKAKERKNGSKKKSK